VNRVWAGCQISSTRRCVAAGRACALSSRRRRADATVALVRLTVVWKWGAAASRWAPAACAVPLPLPALPPCSRRQRFFFSARSPSHGPETAVFFSDKKIFSLASSLLHTSSQCFTFSRCASSSTPPGEGRAARGTRQDARCDACAALDLRRRLCVRCAHAGSTKPSRGQALLAAASWAWAVRGRGGGRKRQSYARGWVQTRRAQR